LNAIILTIRYPETYTAPNKMKLVQTTKKFGLEQHTRYRN